MEILTVKPPILNTADVPGSFQEIINYLYKVMEIIDFTLSKNQRQIMQTDDSSTGTQNQINELRASVVSLSQSIVSLTNRLNTAESDLEDLETQVGGISTALGSIQTQIGTMTSKIAELDSRVSALENPVAP